MLQTTFIYMLCRAHTAIHKQFATNLLAMWTLTNKMHWIAFAPGQTICSGRVQLRL